MKQVQIFQNNQFGQIRVAATETGEPLFCLADLCKALSLSNPSAVASKLDEEDKPKLDLGLAGQKPTFVTEPGMYTVILRSDSPLAKPMQKWVTSEVLPAIRKTGGYMVDKTDDTPETIMARALQIADETMRRRQAEIESLKIQNEVQQRELIEAAPKVRYFEETLDSSTFITINKIALDLGMSAIRLNRILCERHIQYREGSSYVLYAKYRDKGYASLRPHPYIDSLGRQQTSQHLYWTEKGRQFIHSVLKSN